VERASVPPLATRRADGAGQPGDEASLPFPQRGQRRRRRCQQLPGRPADSHIISDRGNYRGRSAVDFRPRAGVGGGRKHV